MNVAFHAVTSFGIGHVAARSLAPDSTSGFDRRDTRALITAFVAGIVSHGVLDGLKHGYPIPYAVDPPLALLLAAAWCAIVKKRFRILFAVVFVGAVLPDLVDLGPAVINRLLGWHLPTFHPHLFPWHWVDGSGSLYDLNGAAGRPGHGDLNAGDNRVISATNHVIVLFLAIAAIVSNREPFRLRRG
jgi:hypothetical protein